MKIRWGSVLCLRLLGGVQLGKMVMSLKMLLLKVPAAQKRVGCVRVLRASFTVLSMQENKFAGVHKQKPSDSLEMEGSKLTWQVVLTP